MRVKLRFFGALKESCGVGEASWEIVEGQSVAVLLEELRAGVRMPIQLLAASAVAVNQEYAGPSRVLQDGDEVAILPPVSGGWFEG